jgi:hypothetical protein
VNLEDWWAWGDVGLVVGEALDADHDAAKIIARLVKLNPNIARAVIIDSVVGMLDDMLTQADQLGDPGGVKLGALLDEALGIAKREGVKV